MTACQFNMLIGGSQCVTTLDVILGDTSEPDAVLALFDWWTAGVNQYLSQDLTLQEIRCGEAASVIGIQGSAALPAAPSSCALILQKNTGTAVRGRMFIPGIAEEDVNPGGIVGLELRALLTGLLTTVTLALETAGVVPAVKTGPVGSETLVPITSFQPRPLIGTLRNRLYGR